MGLSIRRALGAGFRAANTSWPGIACFAGVWALVIAVVIFGVMATQPPAQVFEEAQAPAAVEPLVVEPPSVQLPQVSEPDAEEPTDLFNQLSTAEDVEPEEPATTQDAAQAAADEAQRAEVERRDRLFNEWMGRAWPVLLLCVLVLLAANVGLTGGQLGYLAKRVRGEPAGIAELWRAGMRAFGALLASYALIAGGLVLLLVISGLLVAALGAISQVTPSAVSVLLVIAGMLYGLVLLVGLVWVGVRLVFWSMAIVADRLGPVAGLKRSFALSRGHWWKLSGLLLVTALIGYAVWIPVRVLEWIMERTGGVAISIVVLVASLAGVVASLYVGFASVAALIRCYEDAKAPTA